MKESREIKSLALHVGDVLEDGETVVSVRDVHGAVTLVELEFTWTLTGHDVNGEEIWEDCRPPFEHLGIGTPVTQKVSARRHWYRAGEKLRVTREWREEDNSHVSQSNEGEVQG